MRLLIAASVLVLAPVVIGGAEIAPFSAADAPADSPQQPAPAAAAAALKLIQTSEDVDAIVGRLKAQPPQPLRSAPLLQAPPYTANIEYRTAVAAAAVHETEAELFYVIDGGGTFVVGGQLTESQRTNAQNLSGKAITGGTSQKVKKGDFMLAPAGSPHWFSTIDGTLTLMSLHLPVPK